MTPFVNTNLSILTQVVYKAFVEANKRLPEGEDWSIIEKNTHNLFTTTLKVSDYYEKPHRSPNPEARPQMSPTPPMSPVRQAMQEARLKQQETVKTTQPTQPKDFQEEFNLDEIPF